MLSLVIFLAHLFTVNPVNAQVFDAVNVSSANNVNDPVVVGASRLDYYIKFIKNKSVAVIGNQTSMVGNVHLVDTLLSLGVDVKMVFAPEHGFRGMADAGEKVSDGKDPVSGLPIKSLYGSKNRKPSKELLSSVEVLIFDIQDVGVRFYTYISTMHYIMEACAEQNKLLIVLDRPNPNGHYVDGPVLKRGNESFIGLHPVPVIHGMTIGEYAKMINGEGWLKNSISCSLVVVPCQNYNHNTLYQLPIKPSPNLPNMNSIYLYPSLCLFEGTNVSVGRGTSFPFQIYGSPFVPPTTFSFTPKPFPGAKKPKHNGIKCNGFKLLNYGDSVFKYQQKFTLDWLITMRNASNNKEDFFRKDGFFRLLTGDVEIRKMIENNFSAHEIWLSFQPEVKQFKTLREKYLLYTDFE
ncbi:MAG: exo-beta-N-acetylmuramidase NamZ domain-containing protein [Parvicellaceae bacterium]